jgi:hypothetical protein
MSSTPKPPGLLQPGGFQSLTQPPSSQFSVGNVPAPTALYIGTDSFIRVSVRSTVGAVSLTVHTRMLRSFDGQITVSEDGFNPGSTGAQQFFTINLTEGFLLSAEITADAGTLPRGTVFVSMELCHGSGGNIHRDQLLIQDYVVFGYAAAWPGGTIRLSTDGPGAVLPFTLANPGAGTEISLAFIANTRLRLKSLTALFTTSAAVGNRFPSLKLFQNGNRIYQAAVAAAIPASTATAITWSTQGGPAYVVNNIHVVPLPIDLTLTNTPQLATVTGGLDAADAYTQIFASVESWVDA